MTKRERRNLWTGLAFTSPWIVGLGAFTLYPVLASFYYSFCDYSVLTKPVFIGLGNYTDNARLDYVITDLSTAAMQTLTTHPINTQVQFGGGFIGDYTDLAVGSDGMFHAVWTDTNNKQNVVWFYGYEFVPTSINQEDIVTGSGSF